MENIGLLHEGKWLSMEPCPRSPLSQVVLMTARDEASSFRIFSALNSRGMDLSMVDKLKADLLEVGGHVRERLFVANSAFNGTSLNRGSRGMRDFARMMHFKGTHSKKFTCLLKQKKPHVPVE